MITTKTPGVAPLFAVFLMFQMNPLVWAEEHPENHSHETKIHYDLELNDGKPWLTDEHTTRVANQMKSSLQQFLTKHEEPSLKQLRAQGKELKTHLDSLIRGCTMTGPAHDQLHLWLTKVIPEISHLQNANTQAEGAQSTARLDALLNSYSTFFKDPK